MVKDRLDKLVQLLIPPSLVLLLVVTIYEIFYGVGNLFFFIELFDAYIILLFATDLYYRWQETPRFGPYLKKYWLDIIATIPFNFIFLGVQGLTLVRALRGVRIIARVGRLARFTRLLRLVRAGTRLPRFLRLRKKVKKGKVRKVQPHEKEMKGVLSFKVILLITINSIMGTGIWFLTSAGAKQAGPASLLSWFILSLVSIYIAMCFSELTAMFPKAGGVYEFGKQAYGRFMSFVIGWGTAIAGATTIAMLLLGALQYLLPLKYAAYYVPLAIAILFLFSIVAYRGMQTSKVVLVTFALITLISVIGIIVPGLVNINIEYFDPFFVFPSLNLVLAIFFIAETFFGWESAVFLSAEVKNPTKVMPKALIWGTVVIAVLALLLSFTAMGTIPWQEYAESAAPLRDLGEVHFGSAGRWAFTMLIFISVIGAVAGWIVTAPRLLMSVAEDKLFFQHFAKIHPKNKSPYVSIIFQFILVSALVIVGAGSYETLLHMLVPLVLFVYSAVLAAVLILRYKKPNQVRPYKVPFGRVGPVLTIIFMVFLLFMFIREIHDAAHVLTISGSLLLFGIPAYFAIELFYDTEYVVLRRNLVAKVRALLHKTPGTRPAFKRMVSYVGSLKGKTVVDYNSRLGGLANHIVKKEKGVKKIHVMNAAKEEVSHIKKHVTHKAVEAHTVRSGQIHGKLKKADVFLSYNDLGGVKNLDAHLTKVAKLLRKNGKFCFYITHNFVNVAVNMIELENAKKVKALFKKHGLKADYTKKKFPLREDIYIYGKKVK